MILAVAASWARAKSPKCAAQSIIRRLIRGCLLYTSDAADERSSVDLGGRRIIKKKKKKSFFFFKQKTAYEMLRSLVGSEMCIRDRGQGKVAQVCGAEHNKETDKG